MVLWTGGFLDLFRRIRLGHIISRRPKTYILKRSLLGTLGIKSVSLLWGVLSGRKENRGVFLVWICNLFRV